MRWGAIAVLVGAFLTAPAVNAAAPASPGWSTVKQARVAEVSKADLRAFEHAPISLEYAISIAEGTVGGVVLEARFRVSHGRPVYLMKTFSGWDHSAPEQSVWQGVIDAHTGKVMGKGRTIALSKLDRGDRSALARLQPWYASLGEAVVAAEDSAAGKAISARLSEKNGHMVFEVIVARDMSPIDVAIDATDGRVAS